MPAETPEAYLVATDGPHRGMSWALRGTTSIGREGAIRIDDPHLSRHQATLRWRGGRVRIRHDDGANPSSVRWGPLTLPLPRRWVALPPGARLALGAGTFRVLARSPGLGRERGALPLRLLLPLGFAAAMVPFALAGPAWRWALLALPLLGMLALIGTSRREPIRGRRRGIRPHEISRAQEDGRAFHTEPVLPRRPRILRSGELRGTGWFVASEEEACWLAGYLAVHNDPEVLAVTSPWLSAVGGGLRVRFDPDPAGGPSTSEALVTWGGRIPAWAVPLRLPAACRGSPAWVRSLAHAAPSSGPPSLVHALAPTARALARAWEAPGLAVRLGEGSGGDVFVDLATDGPHALVAGTTGAGKSELLTTWVLGLAAASPPSALMVVLVDFKGGAAFGPLEDLPHCAAVLTDLDPGGTVRALASLKALLQRRERVLREAGFRDIGELSAAHPGRLARLVLVVDEFRALADDHPEILDQLLRLGAQGRSLGVHLIVATQRPSGAVGPDLRANMPLRICLRVAEAADSHDVLGSPAAAHLPRIPGRAILGPHETREVQVAWSGDIDAVRAAVGVIRAAAPGRQEPPWLPPLPASIPAEAHGPAAVAIADLPEELAQLPVALPRTGLLLTGPPRSGRTGAALRCAGAALDQGDEVWVVSADAAVGGGPWARARGRWGGAVASHQVRLVGRLLEHAAAAPGRTVILDDAELWMAAHDQLHGPAAAMAVLATAHRSISAAGSRLVVVAGAEAAGARWAGGFQHRVVLAGTDEAAALLAGVPRAQAASLRRPAPGRGAWLPEEWDAQFVRAPAAPPQTTGRAREFRPLPPPQACVRIPGRVVLGVGGDPLGEVSIEDGEHVVVIGLGHEREAAESVVASQRRRGAGGGTDPVTIGVTPAAWATGWSGELGRVRDTAALLVVRPDLGGAPSGIRIEGELEPGGEGYAVLVREGTAVALRVAGSVVEHLGAAVHDELPRARAREQEDRDRGRGEADQRREPDEADRGDEGHREQQVPRDEHAARPRAGLQQLPRGEGGQGDHEEPEDVEAGILEHAAGAQQFDEREHRHDQHLGHGDGGDRADGTR
ncbi:MAG: FtsK/SpoIIIE domain-containing protein [bacterium]|nr:FtsK/SpoIIIE domain-containing protein [bacterium]